MSQAIRYVATFVDTFPTPMQSGNLYVSTKYSTAGHLCPCGCGNEVVTKLSPARWRITFDGEISLSPSVAATGLPCRSHYFIVRGEVDWRSKLDREQTEDAKRRDAEALRGASRSRRLWRRISARVSRSEQRLASRVRHERRSV